MDDVLRKALGGSGIVFFILVGLLVVANMIHLAGDGDSNGTVAVAPPSAPQIQTLVPELSPSVQQPAADNSTLCGQPNPHPNWTSVPLPPADDLWWNATSIEILPCSTIYFLDAEKFESQCHDISSGNWLPGGTCRSADYVRIRSRTEELNQTAMYRLQPVR